MSFVPSDSFLTKKIGPLPTWGWMLIGLGVAIIWASVKSNRDKEKKKSKEEPASEDYNPYQLIGGNQRPPIVFQSNVTVPMFGGRPYPPSAPGPTAPATPAAGQWVTTAKWTRRDAPWNSTVTGMAKTLLGSEKRWKEIWDAPENQALKARRKKPTDIQPGDKLYVPAGPTGS